MTQVLVKSVPPDIHQLIIANEPLTEDRAQRLRDLLKLHGTEYVHNNMTPLYVAVANGKDQFMQVLLDTGSNILYQCNGQDLIAAIQYLGVAVANKIFRGLIDECKKRLKSKNNLKLDVFMRKLVCQHKKIIAKDPSELSKQVVHVKKDDTIKDIKSYFKDDRSCKKTTIGLKCPMGQVRIKRPGKFIRCRHLTVFDVDYFLQTYCQSLAHQRPSSKSANTSPKCPICNEECTIKELKSLDYYQDVISKTSADEIDINPDGSWNAVTHISNQSILDVDQIVKCEPGLVAAPTRKETRCFRTASSSSNELSKANEEISKLRSELAALSKDTRVLVEGKDSLIAILTKGQKAAHANLRKISELKLQSGTNAVEMTIERRNYEKEKKDLTVEKDRLLGDNTKLEASLKHKDKDKERLKTENKQLQSRVEELTIQLEETRSESTKTKDAMVVYDAIMETGVFTRGNSKRHDKKRSPTHERSPKRKKHKRSRSKDKTKIENNKENKTKALSESKKTSSNTALDDSLIIID